MITKALLNSIDIIAEGWATVLDFELVEELSLLDNTIILPTANLNVIDHENALSPHAPASIFFGDDFRKFTIQLLDETDATIYEGSIKNITTETSNRSVNIELENSSKSIFEQKIRFIADVEDSVTPAEIVRDMLIINKLKDLIQIGDNTVPTLARSIEFQQNKQFFIGTTFSLEDGINLSEALEQLAYVSGAYFYFTDKKLNFQVFEEISDIRRSIKTFTEDDIIDAPVIDFAVDFISNNFTADIKGANDVANQLFTDSGFNNIGQESRVKFGIKDLDNFDLNVDSSPIFTDTTSANILAVIDGAESYIKRFKKDILRTEFSIKTKDFPRFRLNDYFKIDISNSKYDLSDKLFLMNGIRINEQSQKTIISGLESII